MIEIGERVPPATLKRMRDGGIESVAAPALFAGRRVVLFGVPGAFTPTCSNVHLPGFVAHALTSALPVRLAPRERLAGRRRELGAGAQARGEERGGGERAEERDDGRGEEGAAAHARPPGF